MGGCTNCTAKTGCDDRKGSMLQTVDGVLAHVYPSKRWGEPDDEARFDAGVCEHDARALVDEFALELGAATYFARGDDDEYCDYIYILCIGREPSLFRLREGGDASAIASEPVREQYLRVCLSQMARVAGVQQVEMRLELGDDGIAMIHERPRPGVYDAPLLRRFQKLVAILPAYGITHVDFGEISAPPPGYAAGNYAALYGGEPHVANYLFYPQPTTMRTSVAVALDG